MFLHASSLQFSVRPPPPSRSSLTPSTKKWIRPDDDSPRKARAVSVQVVAPLPDYWTHFCGKVGIELEEEVVQGGVWEDGVCIQRGVLEMSRGGVGRGREVEVEVEVGNAD